MSAFKITIGPDDLHGVTYHATIRQHGGWESFDSGGWSGRGPRRAPTPDAWLSLARRRLRLPLPVKAAGLTWNDADVRPHGWSEGAGHAPHGVTILWSWDDLGNVAGGGGQ